MAEDGHRGGRPKALIVGSGVSGIETALALRDLAAERVEVHLHDPRREFVFRPFAISEPYGGARAFRCDLRRLSERCGASFHAGAIVAMDPRRRHAITRDGEQHPYDELIVAPGVQMLCGVPGAVTYWGVAEEGEVSAVIGSLREGVLRSVVFTMPAGPSWVLPLYELALLGTGELGETASGRARITVVTPEDTPLQAFGRGAAEQGSALLAERGVEVITSTEPIEFEGGRLRTAHGEDVDADAVIALPRLEGRPIDGIPRDGNGYVAVDRHGGVIGLDRVHAVGDVSAFPVKQGGIAARQANAAAEAIAAALGAEVEPRPFDPVPDGVVLNGRESLHYDKLTTRYLTPFLESLSAEVDSRGAGRAAAR